MNRSPWVIFLVALLLGGCDPSGKAPAATASANPPTDAPVAAPAATPAVVVAPTATGTQAKADGDDDAATNASIDRLLGDHAAYQAVIVAYQAGVAAGDKAAVAALVAYPITIDRDGGKTTIRDAAAFIREYDRIITPAIARTIKAQKYSALMVNGKGVMFGDGETWINGICRKGSADCSQFEVKVVAIQAGAAG
ncbi:MAG: hypothetical protein ABIP44_07705 [Pseudoxanthomonas sp.]